MSEALKFKRQIQIEFGEKMDEVREKVEEILAFSLTGIINLSPEDTSRFINNWNVSIGVPDPHTTEAVSKGGAASKARGLAKIEEYSAFKGFPSVFIQNALPYAIKLELGHSKQAPSGIISVTVANVETRYAQVIL